MSTRAEHARRPRRESLGKRKRALCRRVLARSGGACVYCGATAGAMHLDHLTPRVHGGGDDEANLVAACATCNSTRRHMRLTVWERYAAEHLGIVFSARNIRRRAAYAARRAQVGSRPRKSF